MLRSVLQPNFLFIGTAKSGSTWIHNALADHPAVFIPRAKDLQFFDYHYDLGLDWYLRKFENAGRALARGELSHDYYLSAEAARRIHHDLPDVRLICCLREPGDFAKSVLRWWRAHTRQFGTSFGEMANHPQFARLLAYRRNLEPYFKLFSEHRICVLFYENLKAQPQGFVQELYEFIGVDPGYRPSMLFQASNVTRPPRNGALLRAAVAAGGILRPLGAANLIGAVKTSRTFNTLLYRDAGTCVDSRVRDELERIAICVRQKAIDEFEPLARLIGKPVPAEWHQATSELI